MSATLVKAPIPAPAFNHESWREDEERYLTTLRSKAKVERSNPRNQASNDSDLVGEIVRWQRADGYAQYMVWSVAPLRLVHLDLGDGYTVEASLLRGLTLADVRGMVAWERSWKTLGEESNAIYQHLRPGDIVHYNNGFAQYVRCEVVSAPDYVSKLGSKGMGGVALKPIALVGHVKRTKTPPWVNEVGTFDGWFEHDLFRRMNDGSIRYGHHAQMILDGELFQPNGSNLYESPTYRDKAGVDPREMEPIDFTPPPLTTDEERRVPLAKARNRIRELVEMRAETEESERSILEQIRDTAQEVL